MSYRGGILADALSDSVADPRNPDRIVYAARRGGTTPCGTFFHDARAKDTWQLSRRVLVVHPAADDSPVDSAGAHPWSPDGRSFYAGNDIGLPVVFDLQERRSIDLTDAVSAEGRRLEMHATVWAPDSRALAVEVAPAGYNGGRDLVSIAIPSLEVQYVASMNGSLPLWTAADYKWEAGRLVVSAYGKNGAIVRKPAGELTWTATRPTSPSPFFEDTPDACR